MQNLKGEDHLEDRGVDVRKILKWILNKQDVKMWTRFIWFRTGSSDSF
jgi:hypothetical protein